MVIALVATQFADTLKAHHLGHLCIGVHVVQVVHTLRHRGEQPTVREALGHVEVFPVTRDGVAIGQHLVHAAVLVAQHLLHLRITKTSRQVDGPVTETQEERLCLFVTTVEPSIAQARVHLMKIIERRPRTEVHPEVTLLESAPDTLTIGHTAHIALAPLRVVLRIGIGTELQLANHVLHTLAALLIARGSIDGHCRQIVSSHVSVQPVPVGIGLGPRFQSCLLAVRSQQPVTVILQQRLYVQVTGFLQRPIQ